MTKINQLDVKNYTFCLFDNGAKLLIGIRGGQLYKRGAIIDYVEKNSDLCGMSNFDIADYLVEHLSGIDYVETGNGGLIICLADK